MRTKLLNDRYGSPGFSDAGYDMIKYTEMTLNNIVVFAYGDIAFGLMLGLTCLRCMV